MIKYIKDKIRQRVDVNMHEVIGKGAIAFLIKMLGVILAFGFHLLIARLLGASGTGLYFLAFTIMTITAIVGRMGLDNSIVRFIAENASKHEWQNVKAILNNTLKATIGATLPLAIIMFLFAEFISKTIFNDADLTKPLQYMAVALLPISCMTIFARALQGIRNVQDSMIILTIITPLVGIALVYLLTPTYGVTGAVIAYTVGVFIALVYGSIKWYSAMREHKTIQASYPMMNVFRSSTPLLGAMLLEQLILASPLLILAVWATSNEIGLFSAAQRAAGILGLILIAANSIIAPKFSALYSKGDIPALGIVARQSALMMTLMATPLMLVFLVAPQWVMSLFGSEFKGAWLMLVIMAVGQLINVMTGAVGSLLIMTGQERKFLSANLVALLICLTLSIALVPIYGGTGAAIAASLAIAVVNLLRVRSIWNTMGIMVLPFFKFKARNIKER